VHAPSKNILAQLALAGLSILPFPARAQEGSNGNNEQGAQQPATDQPGKLTDPLQDGQLSLPAVKKPVDLPQRVLDKAAVMNINPATIELKQGKWLACTDKDCTPIMDASKEEIQKYAKPEVIKGLRVGDNLEITGHQYATHRVDSGKYGIPKLGEFTPAADGTVTFTPYPEFTGTVTAPKRAAPVQKASGTPSQTVGAEVVEFNCSDREALSTLHDRFMLELDTTFVLIVSSKECKWCPPYKASIKALAKQYPPNSKVVFAIADGDTFASTRQTMGPIKTFPTTVIIPALKPDTTFSYVDDPNWQNKTFLSTIQRPGYLVRGKQEPGPLRALISKTLGVVETGIRGVTDSLSKLLGTER
jgi:hypothetical protein